MLESPYNRLVGFKTCNFLKKNLQHRCFPVNIAKFFRTLILMKICKQLLLQFLLLTVNISSQGLVSPLNSIGLLQRSSSKSSSQSVQWQVPLLFEKKRNQPKQSFVVTRCHSLLLVVIRCTTRCHSLYHSLSFVVTRCTTHCYSLSLVVIRCHSLYNSLSLSIPLVYLFINDLCLQIISYGGGTFSCLMEISIKTIRCLPPETVQ